MKRTTIKELSEILEVSKSTVSKALNNSGEISDITKNRVLSLAKEYNYVPNSTARNLKLGRTGRLGVIIPNVLDEFFALLLEGIEHEATRLKHNIVLSISNDQFG